MSFNIEVVKNKKLPTALVAAMAAGVMAPPSVAENFNNPLLPHKEAAKPVHVQHFLDWSREVRLLEHEGRIFEIKVERPKPVKHHMPEHHHLTPAELAKKLVTPLIAKEEGKIHVCEEQNHGWHVNPYIPPHATPQQKAVIYPGGEGMSLENWEASGGDRFDADEAMATKPEQEYVDYEFQKNVLHVIPDQHGCWHGGY